MMCNYAQSIPKFACVFNFSKESVIFIEISDMLGDHSDQIAAGFATLLTANHSHT